MRATLVLMFAVGVSSMKMPEVQTSDMKKTQNYQSLYIPMIDNMIDNMNDIKDMQNEMVKQPCQETTRSAMPEDDSAHKDGVGPRIICNEGLTKKWKYCRNQCSGLIFTKLIRCRSNNWFNYLESCFGGKGEMTCTHPTKSLSERCKEECKLDASCEQEDEKCLLKEQCKSECRDLLDTSIPSTDSLACRKVCDTEDLRRCRRRCNEKFVNGAAYYGCINECKVVGACKEDCDTKIVDITGGTNHLILRTQCKDSCDVILKSTCKANKLGDKEKCQEKCEGNC